MNKFKENCAIVSRLTLRDIKLFLKDKTNVFFSMLAPLIVLLLYVLFLKKIQLDSLSGMIASSPVPISVDEELIKAFLDSWLVSGMLSIGCITVSLGANIIRIQDREMGIVNDMMVSPLKDYLVKISYYLFNFIVTIFIMTIVFLISLIYLGATGAWSMTAGDTFALFGTLIYSSLSATIFTSLITSFCKTQAAHGAIVGIISAIIGFVMGAYMPLDVMPEGVQYVSALIPGTHSAGMMREFLMTGSLEAMGDALIASDPIITEIAREEFVTNIAEAYSMKINFFGTYIKSGYMALYIFGSTIVLFVINMLINDTKPLGYTKSKKRHRK